MGKAEVVSANMAGTAAPTNFCPGTECNIFANEEYAVANAYHFDHESTSLLGQSPSAFNGREVKFTLEKFNDCFKEGYFKLVTNPVASATTEAFVNYYGYMAIPKMHIKLTNNNYTPNNEIPYWKFDEDRIRYNSRQYVQYKQAGGLMGVPLAVRQAALANGHTCYIDLCVGGATHSLENFFWISPLAHELTIVCQLAQASDVIYDPANSGSLISADLSTIINSLDLFHVAVVTDEDARAQAVANHNSDEGLYNYISQPLYWSFNIPSTVTNSFEYTFKETRAFCMMTIFYECEDKTQGWQREPFDIQGPTMTDLGGNTVNFPTTFKLTGGQSTEIVKERDVIMHRRWEHAHRFVDREAGDWILNVPFAIYDPKKDNTVQNSLHSDTWNQLKLRFTWAGGASVTGGSGSGARVTILLHAHNFINNANSDACVLIC